ncbi:phospholipid-transporting ATPase ID [Phthorimaea operculella]|nr:phospholipid-transporting ATPase ID [Phthorimaea operculella]
MYYKCITLDIAPSQSIEMSYLINIAPNSWESTHFVRENERRIKANNREYNAQFRYANNYIKTSKYSIITFLPLNLLEQFQRLANFYFLCLLVLQLIPAISSLTPITTAIPLIGVLALTAVKDAYDDFQRHQNDSQVNHRRAKTLRNGKLVEEKWASVQVGDVIRLENDQFVAADILLLSSSEPNGLCYIETAELDGRRDPAGERPVLLHLGLRYSCYSVCSGDVIRLENDQFVAADILLLSSSEPNGLCYIETAELDGVCSGDVIRLENDQFVAADILLLSSSEPNGLCYIETAELDGETNLKCRQCLLETAAMGQDDAQLGAFDGEIVCETPNNLLNKFEGNCVVAQSAMSPVSDRDCGDGAGRRTTRRLRRRDRLRDAQQPTQ